MTSLSLNRAQVGDSKWDAYVLAHPDGWFWHTCAFIDYALAYAPSAVDRSAALVLRNGRFLGLSPLISADTYGGQEMPMAIHDLGADWEVGNLPRGVRLSSRPFRYGIIPPIDGKLRATEVGTFVLDIRPQLEHLLTAVRKSYRQVIKRAETEYVFETYDSTDLRYPIETARALHFTQAGRATRPMETWEAQYRWMCAGNGLIVIAYAAATHLPAGFAYVVRYKDWAYWFSGATLAPDIQAAIQWRVVAALKARGITHYEIGRDALPEDDQKAKNIAFFKAGFGAERWVVQVVEAV